MKLDSTTISSFGVQTVEEFLFRYAKGFGEVTINSNFGIKILSSMHPAEHRSEVVPQ